MPQRPAWKGNLRLSLVSCPIALYSATSARARLSFNLLHKDTHNRINMKPVDPELGLVERSDLVKGYQYEKGEYVIVEQEDFDKAEIESSHNLVIERFVDAGEFDPLYLDSPYYVTPDGDAAEETFSVIREAMRQQKKVALSRVVLSSREHLIAIAPRGKGFLTTTLRTAEEVRKESEYFDDIPETKPEKEMLDLAVQLIRQKAGKFQPEKFVDRYEQALKEIIESKVAGKEPKISAPPPERGKVIDLMAALKRSVAESAGKRPPAASRERRSAGTAARGKKRTGTRG